MIGIKEQRYPEGGELLPNLVVLFVDMTTTGPSPKSIPSSTSTVLVLLSLIYNQFLFYSALFIFASQRGSPFQLQSFCSSSRNSLCLGSTEFYAEHVRFVYHHPSPQSTSTVTRSSTDLTSSLTDSYITSVSGRHSHLHPAWTLAT